MLFSIALAVSAAAAQVPASDAAQIQAITRRCAVTPERLAFEREETAPGGPDAEPLLPTLVVRGAEPLSQSQLRCIAAAAPLAAAGTPPVDFGLRFEDAAIGARYDRLAHSMRVASARSMLRTMGRLAHLPQRRRGERLAAFARRLERHCAAVPRSVLTAHRGVLALVSDETASAASSGRAARAWLCAVEGATLRGHDPLWVLPVPIPTPFIDDTPPT